MRSKFVWPIKIFYRSSKGQHMKATIPSVANRIMRRARGRYDFPKVHPKLGPLSPTPDDVSGPEIGRDRCFAGYAGMVATAGSRRGRSITRVMFSTDSMSARMHGDQSAPGALLGLDINRRPYHRADIPADCVEGLSTRHG